MRSSLVLAGVILAVGLAACTTAESSTGDAAQIEANKEAALDLSRSIAAAKLPAEADSLLAADFRYHGPAGMGPKGDGEMNKAEYVAYMSGLGAAFSGMNMEFTEVLGEGDRVAVHYTNTFKHTGVFLGVPPSGKEVRITGTFVRQVKDGKVLAEWDNPDTGALMAQVDVLSPLKTATLDVSRAIMKGELAGKADALLDASFAYHGPAGMGAKGDGEMNKAEYVGFMSALSAAFSEMNMEFTQVVAEGDMVGVHYTNTFKHTGTYNGVPPSGNTIVIHGTFVRQVKNGKVIAEWDNPDTGALMAQLGFTFVPPP